VTIGIFWDAIALPYLRINVTAISNAHAHNYYKLGSINTKLVLIVMGILYDEVY